MTPELCTCVYSHAHCLQDFPAFSGFFGLYIFPCPFSPSFLSSLPPSLLSYFLIFETGLYYATQASLELTMQPKLHLRNCGLSFLHTGIAGVSYQARHLPC